ncbi:MAG: hypothetical protein ACOYD7_08270 [Raoultibacter sp.]|jgi:hypothetical protein
MTYEGQREQKPKPHKLGTRFALTNIVLFVLVAGIMLFCSLFVINNIANTVSRDYAELHSARVNGILNSHIRI